MAAPSLRRIPGTLVAGSAAPGLRVYGTAHRASQRPTGRPASADGCPTGGGLSCMSEVRVHNFAISLDGYAAGPDQSLEEPARASAASGCTSGSSQPATFDAHASARTVVDDGVDDYLAAGDDGIGATIMGRNMFGPIRGDVGRRALDGLVGRRTRRSTTRCSCSPTTRGRPLTMEGGTTFHFVDRGHRGGAATGLRGGRRGRRPAGRWRRHHPAVPARRAGRRDARRDRARPARRRGAPVRRPRRRLDGGGRGVHAVGGRRPRETAPSLTPWTHDRRLRHGAHVRPPARRAPHLAPHRRHQRVGDPGRRREGQGAQGRGQAGDRLRCGGAGSSRRRTTSSRPPSPPAVSRRCTATPRPADCPRSRTPSSPRRRGTPACRPPRRTCW